MPRLYLVVFWIDGDSATRSTTDPDKAIRWLHSVRDRYADAAYLFVTDESGKVERLDDF